MVYSTSRHGTTWLDGEQVAHPPHRAMIFDHSRTLRIHDASFQISWPNIPRADHSRYRSRLLALASQLRSDPEIFDLTDLENDLISAPNTAPATRPASPHGTPFGEVNEDQDHVKVEELGRGSYGTAWKAIDRLTGNFIAVKQLHRTTENLEGLRREINHMRALRRVCLSLLFPGKFLLTLAPGEHCSTAQLAATG